ncbi:MAG TPA: efflux RND transporter permease subunit [Aeromonadales bacterium]|nr:efflux RND transporter permease subunit [Aeromonadales bacterium]
MVQFIIRWSIKNRILILLISILFSIWGIYSIKQIPLDALPDLSDVQVIIRTSYPGQPPDVVEDQITYPLSTALLAVPGATTVRGYSFFGDSFVYIIFSDKTDLYWARSRVLEYLSELSDDLPSGVKPQLGPDATGVDWIYQYALLDRTGKHDLSELKSLQDWSIKYDLQSVPGVAEVATVGGMVKQYQVEIDPNKLRGYYLTIGNVKQAISDSVKQLGGSVLEISEAEYMVRMNGYLKSIKDIGLISIPTIRRRTSINSVLLEDISSDISIGPAARRNIAELDGEGEVVGGIVIMRSGENALHTINRIKKKIEYIKTSLPDGVELIETYDRSALIKRGITNLTHQLIEELIIVVLVCAVFLLHIRSSLVIVLSLPIGILIAFIIMKNQGVNANIMSLGGIAIAIGAMVDASIVMIENVHKHFERLATSMKTDKFSTAQRIETISQAVLEVGSPLFFSLLIITISFLPVFALQAQEARLFFPLAITKTYAMAIAAALSITLVPALIVMMVKGQIRKESDNFISKKIMDIYKPFLDWALKNPMLLTLTLCFIFISVIYPVRHIGSEFMPEMDEGDLLYMPTTLPSISIGKAKQLLQQTDQMIKTIPEVKRVFGKVGRAETATDPAPLTMIETTILLKPKELWREGMTLKKLKQELDQKVQIPSLSNAWLMPIRARIDMLSTGINTPIGLKISGPNLKKIQEIGKRIEPILKSLKNTASVYSERTTGARYIDIDIDRYAAAHFGLSVAEILEVASIAIGGKNIIMNVEGRERYAINLRYPQGMRDSISKLKSLQIIATEDTHVQLQDLAEIKISEGPPVIKSENGKLNSWIYVTQKDADLGDYIKRAQQEIKDKVNIPAGYSVEWVGQYKYMKRAEERVTKIIPFALIIILILLYMCFDNLAESFMVILSVPLALVGGFWLIYILGYNMSIAVAVGFIALAGVAAEFGVVMIVYLKEAINRKQPVNREQLKQAVIEGALKRVRPKAMTALVISAGFIPVMLANGTGSEIMHRIAAPMLGGMITAPLVSMVVIPVIYYFWICFREKITS